MQSKHRSSALTKDITTVKLFNLMQKSKMQHHGHDRNYNQNVIPNYGPNDDHGQSRIATVPSNYEYYSRDDGHGPTIKVSEDQNLLFTSTHSDNSHVDGHDLVETHDYGGKQDHDQVVKALDVQLKTHRDHHGYNSGYDLPVMALKQ